MQLRRARPQAGGWRGSAWRKTGVRGEGAGTGRHAGVLGWAGARPRHTHALPWGESPGTQPTCLAELRRLQGGGVGAHPRYHTPISTVPTPILVPFVRSLRSGGRVGAVGRGAGGSVAGAEEGDGRWVPVYLGAHEYATVKEDGRRRTKYCLSPQYLSPRIQSVPGAVFDLCPWVFTGPGSANKLPVCRGPGLFLPVIAVWGRCGGQRGAHFRRRWLRGFHFPLGFLPNFVFVYLWFFSSSRHPRPVG